MAANKGFITVATGKEQYYILAYNLLQSYRRHSKSPTPFAIICDQHNEWTADFDDVVIMEHPVHSFVDKLSFMDLSPYGESIFIDADSLAYRDLNELWDLFKDGPDLGVLGSTQLPDENGWWMTENLGALKDRVDFKVMAMGGLYYTRNNGNQFPAIKETCRYIEEHYLDYHFGIFEKVLSDETIMSLTAAVHHIKPICHYNGIYAIYPIVRCVSADICKGKLRYYWKNGSGRPIKDGFFIHFGTSNTLGKQSDGLYYREVYRLRSHPDRRKDWRDRIQLFGRRMVNHSRLVRAVADMFPKELRNKYNKLDSRGFNWGDPDLVK